MPVAKVIQFMKRFHFDLKRGNVALVRQRLSRACHSLKDPALFIVQALVSIGTVIKARNMESDLGLAISHMLVESFEFYLRALKETKTNNSSTAEVPSAENVSCASQKEKPSEAPTPREKTSIDGCLILFEECCSDDGGNLTGEVEKGASSHPMPISTEMADQTPSSAENISPRLGCDAISRHSLLACNEGSGDSIHRAPQPLQDSEFAEMPWKGNADSALVTSSLPKQSLQAKVNGTAADGKGGDEIARLPKEALSRNSPSLPLRSISQEGVDTLRSSNQQQNLSWLSGTNDPNSTSAASVGEILLDPKSNMNPIQHRHQETLLNEIAARRNSLQVFVALDVFEMRPCLMRPLDRNQETFDTYGSTLVRQLLAIERLYEATVVVSRFFYVRDVMLDLELLSRLLALPDGHQDQAALLHEFVGEHLDTCQVVLQEIDLRLSIQLAQWSGEDNEGDPSVAEMFRSSSPCAGSSYELMMQILSITCACVRLVELAMSLMMRFQIENSPPHYPGILFFRRFCTVRTLLEYRSSSPDSQNHQLLPPTKSMGSEHLIAPALPRPWVLIPILLSTIKDDLMLQMLTIQYCLVERKDSVTASFLATKLGLGEYYQFCAAKTQIGQPQAVVDSIQREQARLPKTQPSAVISTSKIPPSSRWLEPTSDLWRSPSTWPQPAPKSAPPATNHLDLSFRPQLNEQQQQQQQQHQQQQQQHQLPTRVQKPRCVQSVLPFYRLPVNTSVILIDDASQLPQLWSTLCQSRVVGIDSECKPTMDSRDLTQSYPRRSVSGSATTLIQLACDYDNRVYLLDVVALKQDCGERLVKILGNLFANPSVRKIAYDWRDDKTRLEMTFPALQHRCYELQNLVDLRYVWLHYRYCEFAMPGASRSSTSISSCNNTFNNYHHVDNRIMLAESPWRSLRRVEILAWSTLSYSPGLMSRCCGGLSVMLIRLCGLRLDKTLQCSDWERRPLTEQQKIYAGEDRA
ncbi:unnamed protein product [Mortierella alpina]